MEERGPIASVFIIHRGLSVLDEGASTDELLEKVLLYLPSHHTPMARLKALGVAEGLIDFAQRFRPSSNAVQTVQMEHSILAFLEVEPEVWFVVKANRKWENSQNYSTSSIQWEDSHLLAWMKKVYQTYALFFGTVVSAMNEIVDFEKQSSLHTWLLSKANVQHEKKSGMELMQDILKVRKKIRKLKLAQELESVEGDDQGNELPETKFEVVEVKNQLDLDATSNFSSRQESVDNHSETGSLGNTLEDPSHGTSSSPLSRAKQDLMSLLMVSPAETIRQEMAKFFPEYVSNPTPETFQDYSVGISGFKVTALDPAIMLAVTRLETSLLNRFEDSGLVSISILFQGEVLWCSTSSCKLALLVDYMQNTCIATHDELSTSKRNLLKVGKKTKHRGCLNHFGSMLTLSPASIGRKYLDKQEPLASDEYPDVNDADGTSFFSRGFLTGQSTSFSFLDSTGNKKVFQENSVLPSLWQPEVHTTHLSEAQAQYKDYLKPQKLTIYYYGPITFLIFFQEEVLLADSAQGGFNENVGNEVNQPEQKQTKSNSIQTSIQKLDNEVNRNKLCQSDKQLKDAHTLQILTAQLGAREVAVEMNKPASDLPHEVSAMKPSTLDATCKSDNRNAGPADSNNNQISTPNTEDSVCGSDQTEQHTLDESNTDDICTEDQMNIAHKPTSTPNTEGSVCESDQTEQHALDEPITDDICTEDQLNIAHKPTFSGSNASDGSNSFNDRMMGLNLNGQSTSDMSEAEFHSYVSKESWNKIDVAGELNHSETPSNGLPVKDLAGATTTKLNINGLAQFDENNAENASSRTSNASTEDVHTQPEERKEAISQKILDFFQELEVFIAPELDSFITIILQRLRQQDPEHQQNSVTYLEENKETVLLGEYIQEKIKIQPEEMLRLKRYADRTSNHHSSERERQELIVKLEGPSNDWIVSKKSFGRDILLSINSCSTLLELKGKLDAFEKKELASLCLS